MRVLIVLGSKEFAETWAHVIVSEVDDADVRSCSTQALDHVLQTFAPELVIVPDELHGADAEHLRMRGFTVVEVRQRDNYENARVCVERALSAVLYK